MSRAQKQREIKGLRRRENELLVAIANGRARFDRLREARESIPPSEQVKYDLAVEALTEVRRNQETRRGALKKTRQAIGRKRRQLRNMVRPKVIVLDLVFKPMAQQPGAAGMTDVIGHYTAGPQDTGTEDAIRLCHIYHQAHLSQGWSGEAYHWCVTTDGDILVLRPASAVGAHTLGKNTGTYGMMCHGTTGDTPTAAQAKAVKWLGANAHKLNNRGKASLRIDRLPWSLHRDWNATACPGSFDKMYRAKGG